MFALSWPAVASLAAGGVSLSFVRALWPRRENSGAQMFILTIALVAVWSLSYGVALTVFDLALRELLEVPIWLSVNFVGVAFLAFALTYTGRGDRANSWWMGALVLWATLNSVVVITNRYTHLAWTNYHIAPTFGAATVQYTHTPWLFVNVTSVALTVALASFVLLETVLSYGPLYRRQALALAFSPIPPGVAYIAWLFQLGPVPALNLTPFLFPLHLAMDTYALFTQGMFEMTPATRRIGERAAIDDIGSAVAIVDTHRRVVTLNPAAAALFETDVQTALGQPLTHYLPEPLSFDGSTQTLTLDRDGRRVYDVTTNPLTSPDGANVGHTVLLYDVTDERRLKQRLEVLNRVLRHNLRNDLNVAAGNLDLALERVTDDDTTRVLETADGKVRDVIDLGETSRRIEAALASAGTTTAIDARKAIGAAVESARDGRGDAVVVLDVPEDLRIEGAPRLVDGLFEALAENAFEHAGSAPVFTVDLVERTDAVATFELRDDGAGIPAHELAPVTTGSETDLQHGSGLGLWFVRWATDALGGTVAYDTPEAGGTVVTLTLPVANADDGDIAER